MAEVNLKVSIQTLKMIEALKQKLSQKERFSWLKHLTAEEFLDFFFGFSEVSQYCREEFFATLKEIDRETATTPLTTETTATTTIAEAEAPIRVTETQKKVIDALKEKASSLTMRQIAEATKLTVSQVNAILDHLKKKGIVARVLGTHEWKLNTQKPIIVEKTTQEKIMNLLESIENPLETTEIAKRTGSKIKTVRAELWQLYKDGKVERIPLPSRKTAWKKKG